MNFGNLLAIPVSMLALTACISVQEDYRPPDFIFKNKDVKSVKGAIALQMTDDKWHVKADTETTMAFRTSQFDAGLAVNLAFTCNACRAPETEAAMVIVQTGKDVLVRYDVAWFMNPGSAFERRIDARGERGRVSNTIEAALLRAGGSEKGSTYTP